MQCGSWLHCIRFVSCAHLRTLQHSRTMFRHDDCARHQTCSYFREERPEGKKVSLRQNMKTILLVEDNADSREFVAFMLRRDGYEVVEAENGRDALDQLESMHGLPCLLILDLMMPVMSGSELLHVMGERSPLTGVPVIVLTAGGQPSHEPNVVKFLRKPIDSHLVRGAVREICGAP